MAASPDAGLFPDQPRPRSDLWQRPLVLPAPGPRRAGLIDRVPAEPEITVQVNSVRRRKLVVLSRHGRIVLPAAGDLGDGLLSGAPPIEPAISRSLVLGLRRARAVCPVPSTWPATTH